MDSSIAKKQKFVSTEAALRRARELSLDKDDLVISKIIKVMEEYLRGEKTWTDWIEKHHDNGKSHLHSRIFLTAANLCLFDPENENISNARDICKNQLKKSFISDTFNFGAWQKANLDYSGTCLYAYMVYPLWLLQYSDCLSDDIQRKYLSYIWNRENGIYYISNSAPKIKLNLEDKGFVTWLSALEVLSGFSLFSEFVNSEIYEHLIREINRLICDDVKFPPSHPITGHYAESWRDKNTRRNDMILRISRILVKCGI